jgi:hypothetical protein
MDIIDNQIPIGEEDVSDVLMMFPISAGKTDCDRFPSNNEFSLSFATDKALREEGERINMEHSYSESQSQDTTRTSSVEDGHYQQQQHGHSVSSSSVDGVAPDFCWKGAQFSSELTLHDVHATKGICEYMEHARCKADFLYGLIMSRENKEHLFHYERMAKSLLRMMRVSDQMKEQTSVVLGLCNVLFGVNTCNGIEAIIPEYTFPYPAMYNELLYSISVAATNIMTFVQNDHNSTIIGSDEVSRNARKVFARRALFLVSLHFDLSFTQYILSPSAKIPFLSIDGVCAFIRGGLIVPIMNLLNGDFSDIPLFVTECFSTYVMYTDINPFQGDYGGGPLPIFVDSWNAWWIAKDKEYKMAAKKRKASKMTENTDGRNGNDVGGISSNSSSNNGSRNVTGDANSDFENNYSNHHQQRSVPSSTDNGPSRLSRIRKANTVSDFKGQGIVKKPFF